MVSAVPETHWHVKLGSHGNLKEREGKTEQVGSLATEAGQLRGGPTRWPLGPSVVSEKTTDTRVLVNACVWQVSLGGRQARARMLIPGETAQPSVPIWALLVVRDGKEKYLSPSVFPPL